MNRDRVIAELQSRQGELATMGVGSLSVFGSVAHGKAKHDSDIDLLVEFSRPVGLFEFVRVRRHLEGILGNEVDLVTPDALRESMRKQILEEAIRVTPVMDPTD